MGWEILEKKTIYSVICVYSYRSYLLETVHAKQWFVSRHDGTSKDNCGRNVSSPCKTIQQVTVHACDGDIINIDGTGTSRDPYPCRDEKGLDLAGLGLRSYKSRPVVSCRTNGLRFFCDIASRGVVSLEEITFVNTSIHLFECSLNMTACSFINSSVLSVTLKYDAYLMRNVQLTGCTFQNNSASSITINRYSSVNLNVSNSTFVSNKMRSEEDAILNMYMYIQTLQANQSSIKVNFTDTRVSHNICSGLACFQVFARIDRADFVMERVLFENNAAEGDILYIGIDAHHSYVVLRSSKIVKNSGGGINILLDAFGEHLDDTGSFVMENTFISENIDFLLWIDTYEQALQPEYHLKNVSFVNNSCLAYGCIRVETCNSNCLFHLEQSTFLNNVGYSGVLSIDPSDPTGKSITQLRTIINNSEFRNNSGGEKSILTLLNVYGIEIQNCNFIDNFGGVFSSHINIERCLGNLKMWNTSFYQSVGSQSFYTGLFTDVVTFNRFLAVTKSEHVEIRQSSFILDFFSADSKEIAVVENGVEKAATDILDGSVQIESPINTKLHLQSLPKRPLSHKNWFGSVLSVVLWELTASVEEHRVATASRK